MAPLTLLLLRHGIAEEREAGRDDAERALTEAGRRRTRAVLEKAVALGLAAERLIASPLLRARQTAELAVAAGLAPSLELATALAPAGDPSPLLTAWLQAAADPAAAQVRRSLALVGHEPDLGDLGARLIGARSGALQLRKAGLALLEWQIDALVPGSVSAAPAAGQWQLRLLLAPRFLLG